MASETSSGDGEDPASDEEVDDEEREEIPDEGSPVEVIRRSINRSWRFISAYRLGLDGKAAARAAQKFRQHRTVSRRAMMSIEAVLSRRQT